MFIFSIFDSIKKTKFNIFFHDLHSDINDYHEDVSVMEDEASYREIDNFIKGHFAMRHLIANIYDGKGNLLFENKPVFCYREWGQDDENIVYRDGDMLAMGWFEDDRVVHDSKFMPLGSLNFIMNDDADKSTDKF